MPGSFIDLSETGSGPVERLRATIIDFNETTATQTAQLVQLTRALVALTVLLWPGDPDRPRDHQLGEPVTAPSVRCRSSAAMAD